MSTLRISNIEAKSVPASATVDEKVKITNSSGDVLVFLDGKTSGITTVGINTTDGNITFDANSNIVVTGIITATKFVGTIEPTDLPVSGDLSIADKIIHIGDTNTAIRFPAADTITAETGGSERLRIDSNGFLGISTASVLAPFHAFNATNNTIARIESGDATCRLQLVDSAGTGFVAVSGDNLIFANTSSITERLRIDSSGRLIQRYSAAPYGNRAATFQSPAGETSTYIAVVNTETNGASGILFGDHAGQNAGNFDAYINYSHQYQHLQFLVGSGTERVRIRASGQVQFSNGTFSDNVDCIMANGGTMEIGAQSVMKFRTATNERLRITSSNATLSGTTDGVLNITTTDSRGSFIRFQQNGTSKCFVGCAQGLGSGDQDDLGLRTTDNILFLIGSTEEFKISGTNGRLERSFGGGSGSGSDLDGMWFNNDQAASGTFVRFWQTSGSYGANQIGSISHSANNTSYNTSSDYRLKENAVLISDGITRLKTLKPYRFNFKTEPSKTVDGFFAHEAATVVPEAVTGTKDEVATADDDAIGQKKGDPIHQGMDYAKITPLLTAALQEAIAKIETLEAEIAALKSS